MTPEQEEHLFQIKERFESLLDRKYRKGQEEHGGDLFEKDALWLVDNAIAETIDQAVYLFTLRDKIEELMENVDA